MSEKPFEEEEEEQQEHKTGRSAYFAGVHAADGYSGSYRGVKAAPHGGAAAVKDEDTLGSATYCWCGDTFDHPWPGKESGAKHPRKEKDMSTAAPQHHEDRFDSTQMKTFDRRVVRFVTDLANDYGVRVRVLDGSHVILYGLDGEGSLKVSASRHAEQTLGYLEKFTREHVATELTAVKAEALAEHFNDPTKKRRTPAVKAAAKKTAPTPTKTAEAAPSPVSAPPVVVERTEDRTVRDLNPDAVAPEGYEQHYSSGGEALNWWKKTGAREWLCKSCDFTASGSLHGAGAHTGVHTVPAERRAETSSLGGAARDNEMAGKRSRARNAIKFLASEYGLEVSVGRAKSDPKQAKQIERLSADLKKVTAERDELKARLALMKEALSA